MTDSTMVSGVEGITEAIHRGAVEERGRGEPTWLATARAEAWSTYTDLPMPTTRLEEWRYTDLSEHLDLSSLHLREGGEGEDGSVPQDRDDTAVSGRVRIIDGVVTAVELDPELVKKGVLLSSLRDAVRNHEALVRPHLGEALPASAGKFPALNLALWTDGIFLHVPRGVRLDAPILVSRWVSDEGVALFTRTLIVAERESQVSFIDEVASDDFERQTFVSSAVEVVARDGAQLQYVSVQRLGQGAFYQSAQQTLAYRDSTLDTLNISLGASVARVDLSAQLLGPGANSDMLGLCFADRDQHFDHNTRQDHIAPHTQSDLLYKGALDGTARTVFRGIIRVHRDAQQTDAYQTNRNLLLSEGTRADSLPNLEIEADDVKCSHGATVGQLDEETLFYLMSRGMSRQRAERLIVLGFLGEVLDRLPLGGVAKRVTRVIEEKLDRHG